MGNIGTRGKTKLTVSREFKPALSALLYIQRTNMVDKKTMSVHSRAYLFLVNTADVPLTYRNFGVLQLHQFFFFFFHFFR